MEKKLLNIFLLVINLIFIVFLPIVILRFYKKSLSNRAYRSRLLERFGFIRKKIRYTPNNKNTNSFIKYESIWVQATSLGEFKTSIPLLKEILQNNPNTIITVTTTTPTASDEIQNFIKNHVQYKLQHVYSPLDCWICVRLFLMAVKPTVVILMETGIWPNTIKQVKEFSQAKLYFVNAGMSPGTRKKHSSRLLKPLSNHLLQQFDKIFPRSQLDYDFFGFILGKKDKIEQPGNLKFDVENQPQQLETGRYLRSRLFKSTDIVIVATSTHDGEEELVLQAYTKLLCTYGQNVKLILVPRHPERFHSVYKLIKSMRFNALKFSHLLNQKSFDKLQISDQSERNVYLADEMGQMYKYFGMGNIALVCGSFVPGIGGHNVLEPAICKLTVITGQYIFNQKQIVEEMHKNNALIVHQGTDLFNTLDTILKNKVLNLYESNAYNFVMARRGVAKKILAEIV